MKQSPSSGGMSTHNTTTHAEIRDNAYWADEALLADFAEQDDRLERADRPIEESSEYAVLYFVS